MPRIVNAIEAVPTGFVTMLMACEMYGVPVDSLRALVNRNPTKIKKYRVGSTIIVRETDLENMGLKRVVEV